MPVGVALFPFRSDGEGFPWDVIIVHGCAFCMYRDREWGGSRCG